MVFGGGGLEIGEVELSTGNTGREGNWRGPLCAYWSPGNATPSSASCAVVRLVDLPRAACVLLPFCVVQPKFRPQPEEEYGAYPANIMFDKRVIRGNTYAAQILPAALPAVRRRHQTTTANENTS